MGIHKPVETLKAVRAELVEALACHSIVRQAHDQDERQFY